MWVFGPGRVWKWSGGGFGFIWTKFQPKRTILDPFGSIFGTIYFSKSCWPRNLLPGDVVEIFRALIYEKLSFWRVFPFLINQEVFLMFGVRTTWGSDNYLWTPLEFGASTQIISIELFHCFPQ